MDDANFKVVTPVNMELAGLRVCDLFVPNDVQWDVEMLHELFLPRDVEAILAIPLCSNEVEDMCIWHYGRNGEYTVRSAYRLVMEKLADMSHLHVPGEWARLWHLNLPPKVKNFVWRVAREVLPSRAALRRRGIDVTPDCGLCAGMYEDSWHLFVDCAYARGCWHQAGILDVVDRAKAGAGSVLEWLFHVIRTAAEPVVCKVIMILWSIWKERNERVWNNVSRPPEIVVHLGAGNVDGLGLSEGRV